MHKRRSFFEYFEEHPIGAAPIGRRKKLDAVKDPILRELKEFEPSNAEWFLAREIEGRSDAPLTEGVWQLTSNRVSRHTGDPGAKHFNTSERRLDVNVLPQSLRIHHYFRIFSAQECVRVIDNGGSASLGIEVTEEWHAPPRGEIEIPPGSKPINSHCIGALQWLPAERRFIFPNSWGQEWGDNGYGYIRPEVVDRYMIECWGLVGAGLSAPLITKSGLVALIWKSTAGGGEVHGRELVDAASGERIAWCFMVRRGNVLDIEEIFVWPSYRGRGYGARIVELAKELSTLLRCSLRALVGFADAEAANRPALERVMQLLGLSLHDSSMQTVAFIGLPLANNTPVVGPRIPMRPASIANDLDPANAPRKYTVWFGTNRRPLDDVNHTRGFSGDRGESVYYGKCDIAIPRTHRFGSVGPAFWRKCLRLTHDVPLKIVSQHALDPNDFWASIAAEVGSNDEEKQVLIYLHGYRTTFEDAAIRAAQIGYDLRFPGVTSFFSWASAGTAHSYHRDEASIEWSEQAIFEFLKDVVLKSGAERIHIIAHSMGNRALLRALNSLAQKPDIAGARFGNLILAAPDVDAAVFVNLSTLLTSCSERITLYVSPSDRAIQLSKWLHGYPRAGLAPPVTIVEGIDTVSVPNFDLTDPTWHAYFAEAAPLLHDIFTLIRMDLPPPQRQRMGRQFTEDGRTYWELAK